MNRAGTKLGPFETALVYLFENEGLIYSDDKSDSGGPTKYGITQKSYSEFLRRTVTSTEIQSLTIIEAKTFYFKQFWAPLNCGQIDQPISTSIFDTGVLYGIWWAAILAQRALKECGVDIKVDGVIGAQTTAELNAITEARFLRKYNILIKARIDSLVALSPKNLKYQTGWIKRADRLLSLSPIQLS